MNRSFFKFFIKVGYRYPLKALWHAFIVSRRFNVSSPEYIVALLHDAIEDKYSTIEELTSLFGLSEGEIAALLAITRTYQEGTYKQYIRKVSDNVTATHVKLSDLTHNIHRCGHKFVWASLKDRYQKAYSYLADKLWEKENGK